MEQVQPATIVSILSDFGLHDTYVGQMKGVILATCPGAQLIDLTHEVAAQDVTDGAFHLATAWSAFPPGTVHLAVVDPGVGTDRRAVAFAFRGHYFVLPDNGLGSFVLEGESPDQLVVLDRPESRRAEVSTTFHGRDIFAPAAALLASGKSLDDVGTPTSPDSLVRLSVPPVERVGAIVRGPIVSIDHFGSCRTLIRPSDLPAPPQEVRIRCGRAVIRGIARTYGDVPEGHTLALFGSHGGLEVAVRGGNAARAWEVERGMVVEVSTGG